MQKPLGKIESIAASATGLVPGVIPLVRARTLSITADILFGGSIDADAVVEVYYSPDGRNWDDLVYTSFAVTFTVSVNVQRTVSISVPEHGNIQLKVKNGSSADAIDGVTVWYSIQSWPEWPAQSRGLIETADVYD